MRRTILALLALAAVFASPAVVRSQQTSGPVGSPLPTGQPALYVQGFWLTSAGLQSLTGCDQVGSVNAAATAETVLVAPGAGQTAYICSFTVVSNAVTAHNSSFGWTVAANCSGTATVIWRLIFFSSAATPVYIAPNATAQFWTPIDSGDALCYNNTSASTEAVNYTYAVHA